jgi:glutathione synthase/RimK-type ligase-like ATP-grasp enzyme
MLPFWPRAPLNSPRRILRLARESVGDWLQAATGVVIPRTARLARAQLSLLAEGKVAPAELLTDLQFPLIARPLDFHGGHGLVKLDSGQELNRYLESRSEDVFQVSRFVDYRSADGWFRKYRVVLIGGAAFAVHMGVSEHWMIHYVNAGMAASADKRAEEARFMLNFEHDFGRRHHSALRGIDELAGLDYLVIDCAETVDGRLLVFELDTAAIVHAMDPVEVYPYKHVQMRKVFAAFRAFLARKAAD